LGRQDFRVSFTHCGRPLLACCLLGLPPIPLISGMHWHWIFFVLPTEVYMFTYAHDNATKLLENWKKKYFQFVNSYKQFHFSATWSFSPGCVLLFTDLIVSFVVQVKFLTPLDHNKILLMVSFVCLWHFFLLQVVVAPVLLGYSIQTAFLYVVEFVTLVAPLMSVLASSLMACRFRSLKLTMLFWLGNRRSHAFFYSLSFNVIVTSLRILYA
jgi:hypothetical protein